MSVCARRGATRGPVGNRTVYVNDETRNDEFCDNTVKNTKYTPLTFLPKNLMEQFSKFMNIYFLLIACLQLWSTISPVNPITTWGPLIFIFAVSATKEGIDDYLRHKRDVKANSRLVTVIRQARRQKVPSAALRPGDVIFLSNGEFIPADGVLLATAANGDAYIETSNLDGETDLKSRNALPPTQTAVQDDLLNFRATIECAAPNPEIYVFNSRMSLPSTYTSMSGTAHAMEGDREVYSLSEKQLMLQGTHVKNTAWVAIAIVYTGNETKLGCNKRDPPSKWTKLDKQINRVTMGIFTTQLMLIVTFGVAGYLWQQNVGRESWYLEYNAATEPWYENAVIPLRFMLLMSYMIPISLKITLDLVKFYYARLITWDREMYDARTQTPAQAQNTAISEDLGQIEHIFTDKTGTLTENIMRFAKCSINDELYDDGATDAALLRVLQDARELPLSRDASRLESPSGSGVGAASSVGGAASEKAKANKAIEFFRALALNQTAVPRAENEAEGEAGTSTGVASGSGLPPLRDGDTVPAIMPHLVYQCNSPDEEALIDAAREVGVVFLSREGPAMAISRMGYYEEYEQLAILEFDSVRKRMGVVVRRRSSGKVMLYVKGADEMILPRLAQGEASPISRQHLETFAQRGLRTMMIAMRNISSEDFAQWSSEYETARTAVDDRSGKLRVVYEKLEQNLVFLGITAIEDRLQEEVPETIELLRKAGIRFWMLTGDKYSTALQIATSTRLITRGSTVITIQGKDADGRPLDANALRANMERDCTRARDHAGNNKLAVIVEGEVLGECMKNCREQFLDLSLLAHSVVCCRVTPAQKAQVVAMVRDNGAQCLAIGDGGNDVSMIQEAHVGVGLSGREGLQAARAADYSIARFRFLSRLVLVHGRYSYLRTALIAQYCFYKSLYICLIQIGYNFFGGFSGVSLFNTYSLTTYNVLYTGFPPFCFALDKDINENATFRYPELYGSGPRGEGLSKRTFLSWAARSIFHAVVALTFTVAVYNDYNSSAGYPMDYDSISMVPFTALILVNQATVLIESRWLTSVHLLLVATSILGYYAITSVYNLVPFMAFYTVMNHQFADATYWGTVLITTITSLIPVFFGKYINDWYYPSPVDVIRQTPGAQRRKTDSFMEHQPLLDGNSDSVRRRPSVLNEN